MKSQCILWLSPPFPPVGPRMAFFQGRVLHLQEVVCTCEEAQAITNVVVLEGLHVAECCRTALGSVNSDTFVGNEIINKVEDYKYVASQMSLPALL
jgi:hypothetical protein